MPTPSRLTLAAFVDPQPVYSPRAARAFARSARGDKPVAEPRPVVDLFSPLSRASMSAFHQKGSPSFKDPPSGRRS